MSIRHGLLALLQRQPMHGYQLRGEFESSTGGTWPLNVGQVYTTLTRLERDGCVAPGTAAAAPAVAEDSAEVHKTYAITDVGREELTGWFTTPVSRSRRPRDELAIKLAMAIPAPDVDVRAVIQAQRTDTLRALQDYTRLKHQAQDSDLSWLLVLDSLIFGAEAEVRWLDHCEARLIRYRPEPVPPVGALPTADSAPAVTTGARTRR